MLQSALLAQPAALLPEADFGKGLPSNNVLTAQVDDAGSVWVGTDKGLIILGDAKNKLENIRNTTGIQEIWSLAFYKTYVLIASRYNGLYIFDTKTAKLVQHVNKEDVGLCRKLRVIGDRVFLATNGSAFYVALLNNEWKLHRLKGVVKDGFFTDFCTFKGRTYVSGYGFFNQYFFELSGDSIEISKSIRIRPRNILSGNTLCLLSNEEKMVMGGDGFYQVENKNKDGKISILKIGNMRKEYPVWDICFLANRTYLAIGNPDNMYEGMILDESNDKIENIKSNFYGQSLAAVNNDQDLLIGTGNRGVFLWKNAVATFSLKNKIFSSANYSPVNETLGLLYDAKSVRLIDWEKQEQTELLKANPSVILSAEVMTSVGWKDTLAVITSANVYIFDKNGATIKKIQYNSSRLGLANKAVKLKDKLILFSKYRDFIYEIDYKKRASKHKKLTSNDVNAVVYKDHVFYSSANGGFHYYDGEVHNFTSSVKASKNFCIQSDTLWVLNAGILNDYRIDLSKKTLSLIYEVNYQKKVAGFYPLWIHTAAGNIWMGDAKGIIALQSSTGKPRSYFYLGNYEKASSTSADNKHLYFNYDDMVFKIDPNTLYNQANAPLHALLFPEQKLFEQTPFKLLFKSDDYFFEQNSLKEIIVIRNKKAVDTIYTLEESIEFPFGLTNGDYTILINANGKAEKTLRFIIQLPLTSSPIFYAGIVAMLLAIVLLFIRSVFLKRSYEKQILNNRLQLLKQNLNPHFIFNALNLIYSFVLQQKNEAAVKTITDFADLHRYYLENINKPQIPLSEELNFIESYLKLESGRVLIDHHFTYRLPLNVPEEILQQPVPPMILQPLVENAVKYASADGGIREIWIDIEKTPHGWMLGIENTIASENNRTVPSGKGLGLQLVTERIEIYNKSMGVSVSFIDQAPAKHPQMGYRCELVFLQ